MEKMSVANIFDLGAACVFAFFMVRGALRGLTGEIVSLLGLFASVACGWTFAQPLAGVILSYFPDWNRSITELLSAVVLFVCVSLIFAALGKILKAVAKAANLTLTDHVMGTLVGGARAFVLILFIYGVASIFSPAAKEGWVKESLVMKPVAAVWPLVFDTMKQNGWIDVSHLIPVLPDAGPVIFYPGQAPSSQDIPSQSANQSEKAN